MTTRTATPTPAAVRLARRGLRTYPPATLNEPAAPAAVDMVATVVLGLSAEQQRRLGDLNAAGPRIHNIRKHTPTLAELFIVLDLVHVVTSAAGDAA